MFIRESFLCLFCEDFFELLSSFNLIILGFAFEENVIYNATFNGVSLNGSTIYVTGLPTCSDCAKGVIQVGIKRVVMPKQTIPNQWQDSWNLTQQMFKEAGVEYDFI